MAKLSAKDFMEKAKNIIGDRTDDDALAFLEDCKDTITEEKDDWKEKYETVVKEKEELDKQWRTKYRDRFYSSDTNLDENKDKDKDTKHDPFDNRSDAEKQAEQISINDLFKESEE